MLTRHKCGQVDNSSQEQQSRPGTVVLACHLKNAEGGGRGRIGSLRPDLTLGYITRDTVSKPNKIFKDANKSEILKCHTNHIVYMLLIEDLTKDS